MTTLSYAKAQNNLGDIWDKTIATRKPVAISRRGKESIAVLPLEKLHELEKEISGLEETVFLLRSPANARRLLGALDRLSHGEGKKFTMKELREKLNLH